MAKKGIIIAVVIGVGLILILLIGVGAFAFSRVDFGGGGLSRESKFWNECTVDVDENFIGQGVTIENAQCENTGKKCGGIFGINPFVAEGTVELWDSSGRLASERFATSTFTGKDTITLRGCSSDSLFRIRLKDDDGNLQDEITV